MIEIKNSLLTGTIQLDSDKDDMWGEMMKVYILTAECFDAKFVEGVFSTFSAMLTHLDSNYDYKSGITFRSDGGGGKFKDTCGLGDGTLVWSLSFEVYDVIGGHSPHNGCLKCRGDWRCMTQNQLIHLETITQIFVGNIVALVILYFYGMTLTQSLSLQVIFFITSYVRSYFIRKAFSKFNVKQTVS